MLNEKKKLVDKINAINNPDLIEEINALLNKTDSDLSLEQQQSVRERKAEYLSNPEQIISTEEFKKAINIKYGF